MIKIVKEKEIKEILKLAQKILFHTQIVFREILTLLEML